MIPARYLFNPGFRLVLSIPSWYSSKDSMHHVKMSLKMKTTDNLMIAFGLYHDSVMSFLHLAIRKY